MRNSVIFLVMMVFLLMLSSCRKFIDQSHPETENNNSDQKHPVCGMEEIMSKLSSEMKEAILSSALHTEAQATELLLYLDFDGAVILPGFPNPSGNRSPLVNSVRNCPPPSFSSAQIQQITELVKDDFSPFKIVVTTDQEVFNNYPSTNKQICIITTLPAVLGMPSGLSGVAPFASIGIRLPFNPSFVFANVYGGDIDDIAGVISHESAHTMGLGHQHLFNEGCGYIFEYHPGFGTGPTSFVPIMGLSDSKNVTNWWAQNCVSPVFGVMQNDFVLLNSQVELKDDDFPNSPLGETINATNGEINGIVENAGDADFMLINFKNPGRVVVTSKNIDIKVTVFNNGGHLIGIYNDPDNTGVIIPSVNGKRWLKIEAVSNVNMSAEFMTGMYRVTY